MFCCHSSEEIVSQYKEFYKPPLPGGGLEGAGIGKAKKSDLPVPLLVKEGLEE
jgi:hypothetical protein